MTDHKHFDPRAIASITSGTLLLADFGQVHKAIEHVLGHPIWTHELPSMAKRATELILAQYPDMPTQEPDDWQTTASDVLARYGDNIAVTQGCDERTQHPLKTLYDATRLAEKA